MKDEARNKNDLIDELISLRLKVSKLEESQNKRRQTASEIRKAEERFAMLSIATNDAIHDWDLVKNQLWCNEGMQKTLGVHEVIDDPWDWWIKIIHPDDRDRMVSGMQRLMKSNREFGSNEYRIQTAGGTAVYINHRIYILRDSKGKPVRMMGAATNITERKRSEEALRESEERYRAFFETSRDCVFISSAEGRWIDLNDAAVELFGYASKEELKKIFIRELYADPEGRDRFIGQMREKGYVKEYPFDMRKKDGSIIHVLLTSVSWKDAEGNILGYRGTIRDVTDKRRIERELKAKHEELSAAYGQLSAYGEELRRKYNELLESQQALRESEKRYRELTDFLPIAIFEVDTVGNVISFNRTALGVFRYNQEDYKEGMNALQFFPPAEWQRVGKDIVTVLQGTLVTGQEYTFLRKDGSTFTGLIYGSPNIHHNEPVGIRGTIIDITERKQAEEALRQSEEKYRAIIENMEEGYIELDLTGRLTFFNEAAQRFLGYSKEETLGMHYNKYTNKENSEKIFNLYNEVYRTHTPRAQFEWDVIRKDGIKRTVEGSASFMPDAEGRPAGFRGLFRDITDSKRAREELQKSEERYRLLAENANDIIYTVDMDSRLTYISPSVSRILGFSVEEAMGRTMEEAFTPESYELAMRKLAEEMAIESSEQHDTDRSIILQIEIFHKDGSIVPFEIHYSFFRSSEGRPVGILAIARDVSEHKRTEEKQKILQERLHRAEKMEALGTLAGGVAHDLNNVLGVLVGYSELLLQNLPQDSPLRRHALQILKGGERAAAIIQDLLTLTRRGVVVSDVVNLNMLISDFLQTPEFEAMKTHHPDVTFKTSLDAELLNVKGSPMHLGKTAMNLLSNAAEAITGLGEVMIATENRYVDRPIHGYENTQEGEYAILTVSDTGSGIAPSDIGRIFEPFYTKKVMGRSGTGLGLAVVWGTVKDHSGYIDVQSTEGKGTIFTLYFPVTREDLTKIEQVVPQSTYLGRGEHVLVVDDVEGQRLLASAMLEGLGYKVSAVASGEEAVAFIKKQPFDLLILDMIMDPGIDGLETYKRILEIRKSQKAIIVSGFAMTDRVRQTQELGAGTYVKKPYLMEKIGIAVRRELDKQDTLQ